MGELELGEERCCAGKDYGEMAVKLRAQEAALLVKRNCENEKLKFFVVRPYWALPNYFATGYRRQKMKSLTCA